MTWPARLAARHRRPVCHQACPPRLSLGLQLVTSNKLRCHKLSRMAALSLSTLAAPHATCSRQPRLSNRAPAPQRAARRLHKTWAGAENGGEDTAQLVERLMADPENAARIQRVTDAAEKVAALQAESQRLAAAMAEAAADEAVSEEQRERRGQEAAAKLIAAAEVQAAEKLLQAAQLQAESAAAAKSKWAADINEVRLLWAEGRGGGWGRLANAGLHTLLLMHLQKRHLAWACLFFFLLSRLTCPLTTPLPSPLSGRMLRSSSLQRLPQQQAWEAWQPRCHWCCPTAAAQAPRCWRWRLRGWPQHCWV